MQLLTMMQATTTGGVGTSSNASSCKARSGAVELPLHLTERILCSMSPLESARHAAVCKSWASTVSARLARPVPHLFACTPPGTNSDRRGLVLSVPLDGSGKPAIIIPSRVRASDTNGLRCIGAAPGSGRVAFAAGWWSSDVVLVDPVTGGGVHRVDVGEPCRLDPRHSRVLAGDAFFAVDGYTLALWRPDDDGHHGGEEEEAWSRCAVAGATSSPAKNIVSAVNCNNGRFYLLHQDGSLSMVDATAPPPLRTARLPVERLVITDQFDGDTGHLVECDGEVLFVAAGFEVYRLNLNVKGQTWTKIKELPADRALFVSPGSSFAVRASEMEGCRSNCIYFVAERRPLCGDEDGESSWGVYSMEDRRVLFDHVLVTQLGRGAAELFWFLPRVNPSRRASL